MTKEELKSKAAEQYKKGLEWDETRPDMAAGNFYQAKMYRRAAARHGDSADMPDWAMYAMWGFIITVGILAEIF